jgi:hypothetical protein
MECIKELAGNLKVFLESDGVRHIHFREVHYLLGFELGGIIRPDFVKVSLDSDPEGDIGVREEGKPKESS